MDAHIRYFHRLPQVSLACLLIILPAEIHPREVRLLPYSYFVQLHPASRSPSQISGKSRAKSMMKISPTIPIMAIVAENVLSVSCSVKPAILLISQNPLSFIHDTSLDPHPMASAR